MGVPEEAEVEEVAQQIEEGLYKNQKKTWEAQQKKAGAKAVSASSPPKEAMQQISDADETNATPAPATGKEKKGKPLPPPDSAQAAAPLAEVAAPVGGLSKNQKKKMTAKQENAGAKAQEEEVVPEEA